MTNEYAQERAVSPGHRILGGMDRGEWLNLVIGIQAKRTLEHLASSSGVTQRSVLERLLAEAEQQL